jgi:hypothetical protein
MPQGSSNYQERMRRLAEARNRQTEQQARREAAERAAKEQETEKLLNQEENNQNTQNNTSTHKKSNWWKLEFTGKGDWSAGSSKVMLLFYFIVLLAHVIDSFVLEYRNNLVRAILYLVVFVISWFLVFGRDVQPISKEGARKLAFAFMLAFIAFLLPVLEWQLLKNIMDEKLIHILQMWLGFYPSYLIAIAPAPSLKKLQKVWIGMWIILGVLFLIVAMINGGLTRLPMPESDADFDPWESLMSVLNFIWETFWNGIQAVWGAAMGKINQTQAFGESRIDYATGGYYSGQEEDVEKQGVFIEDIEMSKPDYVENETVEIFFNLHMKTPSKNAIDTSVNCFIECDEQNITGDVSDEGTLKLYNNEILPMSCVFREIKRGTNKIIIQTSYRYSTLSRIEGHFIDIERKNAYRAENVDILDQYNKDSSPDAIYTSGPLKLGIEIGTQPIGIEPNSNGPRIGFTLEGEWEGKIESVEKLNLSLPGGLVLDNEQIGDCKNFEEVQVTEDRNVYAYEEEIGEIEDYRSFYCKTKVSDFNSIMGENEISTKYIRVATAYTYQNEEIERITVK